jgi:hypothetical protein
MAKVVATVLLQSAGEIVAIDFTYCVMWKTSKVLKIVLFILGVVMLLSVAEYLHFTQQAGQTKRVVVTKAK